MRPIAPKLSLDREGFALLKKATAVQDFSDEDAVKTVYYPEAEALLRDRTGADRVVIFDHTVRRRLAGAIDRTYRKKIGDSIRYDSRIRLRLSGTAAAAIRWRVQRSLL